MLILAKPQEIFSVDFSDQSKPLRTQPKPFSRHPVSFIVVVPNRQVFLEVFLCVLEVVLRLGRDHGANFTRKEGARCVSDTLPSLLLKCGGKVGVRLEWWRTTQLAPTMPNTNTQRSTPPIAVCFRREESFEPT